MSKKWPGRTDYFIIFCSSWYLHKEFVCGLSQIWKNLATTLGVVLFSPPLEHIWKLPELWMSFWTDYRLLGFWHHMIISQKLCCRRDGEMWLWVTPNKIQRGADINHRSRNDKAAPLVPSVKGWLSMVALIHTPTRTHAHMCCDGVVKKMWNISTWLKKKYWNNYYLSTSYMTQVVRLWIILLTAGTKKTSKYWVWQVEEAELMACDCDCSWDASPYRT